MRKRRHTKKKPKILSVIGVPLVSNQERDKKKTYTIIPCENLEKMSELLPKLNLLHVSRRFHMYGLTDKFGRGLQSLYKDET